MLQKKICMLGAFAVGKTSLVQRFVTSLFDDKYLTTIGVKIDKKVVSIDDREITLMLWDLAGEDEYNHINPSYLRGASACIIVLDGTRPKTLDVALDIEQMVKDNLSEVPVVFALNKADLKSDWQIEADRLSSLNNESTVMETSAKDGKGVEKLFETITSSMLTAGQ